ncbi:hypothetical protein Tco_0007478 [Tanacetum coccineum]
MASQYKTKDLPPWQSHKVSLAKEDKDQGLMVEIEGIGHQANPTAMIKDFGTHSHRFTHPLTGETQPKTKTS